MISPATPIRHLAWSLRAGACYDWIFAAAVLGATPELMRALHFPIPEDMLLFRLTAMPLILFPLVYWAAAADPKGRPWAVRISLAYRLIGGAMLGILALIHRPAGLRTFLIATIIDFLWGTLHAVLWRRALRA